MQRGADTLSGMAPGFTNVLLLGTERPVLFLETRSTELEGSIRRVCAGPVVPTVSSAVLLLIAYITVM